MAVPKIQVTKNYRLFERSSHNRPLELAKHKGLKASMEKYGFLPCFPIVCHRNGDKHLVVDDGQHRLALAETLGLPVYWCETPVVFDVSETAAGQSSWAPRDYAECYAALGNKEYREGLEFADAHGLPIGSAFGLLAGTATFNNVIVDFRYGRFQIKDRNWAEAVVGIYCPLVALDKAVKNARFLDACMAVCRADGFDADRLLHNAKKCREKLVAYATRDAYLDMLEQIYNYKRMSLVGLKVAAIQAMRERNAVYCKSANKLK